MIKQMPRDLFQQSALYYTGLLLSVITVALSYLASGAYKKNALIPGDFTGTFAVLQFALGTLAMLLVWKHAPAFSQIRQYPLLLSVTVLLFLLLIPIDSYLSNDSSRYLFDGKLAVEGYDPYRTPHNTQGLEELKAKWKPPAEHEGFVTLYPPLALALFSVAASAGAEYAVLIWKLLISLAALATVFTTALLLKHYERLNHLPLIALSPLVILESGVGLHLDTFSMLFVALAVLAFSYKKFLMAGILTGSGILIKLLPFALLMPFFLSSGNLKQSLRIVFSAFATVALGYMIMWSLDFHPVGSIGIFFEKWRFGSPLVSFLENQINRQILLIVLLSGGVIAALLIAYSFLKNTDTVHWQGFQLTLAVPLMISPVIFPWYLLPLIPLLAIQPSGWLFVWVITAPLTYEVLNDFLCCNQWQPQVWPLITISALIGVALIVQLLFKDNRKTIC